MRDLVKWIGKAAGCLLFIIFIIAIMSHPARTAEAGKVVNEVDTAYSMRINDGEWLVAFAWEADGVLFLREEYPPVQYITSELCTMAGLILDTEWQEAGIKRFAVLCVDNTNSSFSVEDMVNQLFSMVQEFINSTLDSSA